MGNSYSDEAYDALMSGFFCRHASFQNKGADAYKPGLERVLEICGRMACIPAGCPIIHVAGTNGKGSTCNMLAAALAVAGRVGCDGGGMKVGLYTSPHILDFRERMRVVTRDGVSLISKREVWDFLQEWGCDTDELDLSFFEITTVMAFDFFKKAEVDAIVLETGLGGRLDATNVVVPTLSVITNIGMDHTDLLGGTLQEIAFEKAGIIKDGVPVVVGESDPSTDPVFEEVAARHGAPLCFADREPYAMGMKVDDKVLDDKAFASLLSRMDLQGPYQEKNLRTVLCALSVLTESRDADGLLCFPEADLLGGESMDAITGASEICQFHGRWEKICNEPVTICDIGHNEHGLKYNFAQLEHLLDSGEYSDLVMVYGSVRDKDVDAVLRIIPRNARIFFTSADSRRAMPAEEIRDRYVRVTSDPAGVRARTVVFERVPDAVASAIACCRSLVHPLLYIGGSTYVVSEAVACFGAESVQ